MDDIKGNEDQAAEQAALEPLQVSQMDFYGDTIRVVLVEVNGERHVLVPLRQFCQYLGVDWASQYQRTKRDEILAREMMSVVITTTLMPARGQRQSYPTLCLPLDLLPGWLFTISPSRVKPEFREHVQRYRGFCYRVLWKAFQRGELFPIEESFVDPASATVIKAHDPRIVALDEQIETLSAVVALMQEHKVALLAESNDTTMILAGQQELLTRTDMISSQLDYVVILLELLVGRQETTEKKVTKIDERTAHLTPAHAKYVHDMVDRIVQAIDRKSPGRTLNYARIYAQIYARFKRSFNVSKYDQVDDERFEEVKAWLQKELRQVNTDAPEQGMLF